MEAETQKISCFNCGILFWITKEFDSRLRKSKKGFYCPNGHCQSYTGETCEEKLKKVEWNLKNEKWVSGSLRRSNSAYKGAITKMKNKTAEN